VEEAKRGLLTLDGRKVLIIRGHDGNITTGYIFIEFANRADKTRHKFRFSKAKRSLTEQDPVWNSRTKVTPTRMEEYVKEWFVTTKLLHVHCGEVLIITDEIPKMAAQSWLQNRYLTCMVGMFEMEP
jgi:hypothetical protein